MNEKFIVDAEKLSVEQTLVLKAIYREGERHLKYYTKTMDVFKNPSARLKCFDTTYYESVMPIIIQILRNREENGQ
jgi:hypothetical protein